MKTYTYKFLVVIFSLIFLGSSLSKASAADFMAALLAEDLTTEQVNLVQRKVSHLFTGTKVTENLQWLRQMGVSDVGRVITL
ncbi:MAG TPA: hypothetical protein PLU50_02240, partial [Pseudobdellovibrionaceae bacterium]|nr:hypothetical protein [Pseudobdellovibrionaceae bacterium]